MEKFDIKKINQGYTACTRDGQDVRIICTDRRREYCMVGLVGPDDNIHMWRLDGTSDPGGRADDLFMYPPKRVQDIHIHIYSEHLGSEKRLTREEWLKESKTDSNDNDPWWFKGN